MRRAAATLSLVAGLIAAAWLLWPRGAADRPIEHGACAGCNVLLVTIDTLRSDRTAGFGGAAALTPTLNRLAGEGFRFTRAYAAAPLTLPSHASILTAAAPPSHGVRTNGLFRLAERATLATALRSVGYRTAAFVAAFVLDARFGLNRGFDVYDDRYGEKHAGELTEGAERTADEVVGPALDWILHATAAPSTQHPAPGTRSTQHPAPSTRSTQHPAPSTQHPEGPWFAWVHFYDPHEPYRAPQPYAAQHPPYDAEVAYTDAVLGRALDRLRAAGQLDRTLVVLAADHGESLGEHGERTHGVFVYESTMRVPWLLWAAGRVGGSSDAVVSLTDLAPTVLDLVGVPIPTQFEGSSLVSRARSERSGGTAYLEAMDANLTRNWAPLTGLVADRFKYIDLPLPELYDLAADPHETSNLFTRDAARARTLEAMLRRTTASFGSAATAEATKLSQESRQRLQALGYVASSAGPPKRVYTDADDPKNLIGPANELNRALADFRAGSRPRAMSDVAALIRQYPHFTTAYGVLASMQHDTGDLGGAIATLETLVRDETADQSVLVVLAGYLLEAGRLEQSSQLLEAVVAAHPDYADAYNTLGSVSSRLGRHERARAAFRKVLELDPTSATAHENLGIDEMSTGDLDGAIADLSRALELDPQLPTAHNAIAAAYMKRHQTADAVAHWKRAIELNPRLFDALYNIGTVLYDSGRKAEARPYLERFVADAPPARYAADLPRIRALLAQ